MHSVNGRRNVTVAHQPPSHPAIRAQSRVRGFTLIEVGVVLVIMTLVVTGLLSMFLSQLVNTQVSSTRSREEAIKTALSTFIARNNRLPCPADPLVDASTSAYGLEGTCVAAGGVTVSGNVATGMVPFATLGLSVEATSDGYSNRLTYAMTIPHVPANGHISGMSGLITIHNAGPATGANQINVASPAVAVVLSHGSNGFGAYRSGSPAGTRVPLPGTPAETENTNGDVAFVQKDYSEAAADPFDDIVMAITPADLLTPLQRDGSMQSSNGVTLERMRALQAQIDAQIAASVGTPPYGVVPTTLPTASTQFDAWGRLFQYDTSFTTSVCGSAGNAYRLTSFGPDGTLATPDDIVFTQLSATLKPRVLQNNPSASCS